MKKFASVAVAAALAFGSAGPAPEAEAQVQLVAPVHRTPEVEGAVVLGEDSESSTSSEIGENIGFAIVGLVFITLMLAVITFTWPKYDEHGHLIYPR